MMDGATVIMTAYMILTMVDTATADMATVVADAVVLAADAVGAVIGKP